jgi:uncharacterized membrane protein
VFVTLALASAAFYGAADFLGGIASKRADSVVVTFVAQAAGLVLLALLLPVLPSSSPLPSDYGWGVAAGVAGSAGVALLYRALAIGTMSIVAPITAVCAAAVPVLVALALGDCPDCCRDHAAQSRSVGRDGRSRHAVGDDEHWNGDDFRRCGRTVFSVSRADER